MNKHVLITGGAGFIGSHLADELLDHGYTVRVLDNLCSQVHGKQRMRPGYLNRDVELVEGDVRDPDVVFHALRGVGAVVHLASAIGGQQSMRQVSHFVEINNLGTAVLLEAMMEQNVERMVLGSSAVVYGEGLYRSADGSAVESASRTVAQLKSGQWEVTDDAGAGLTPVATPEWKRPAPGSVYAVSKFDQERMCMMLGEELSIAATALRLFDVYGPRQMPCNAYTGELSVCASRLCAGIAPMVDEDGCQLRDWVSVHDVARAFRLALESSAASDVINIGSGRCHTTSDIAGCVAEVMGQPELQPQASGRHRAGEVRHCYADISKAREVLGFEPKVSLEEGLAEMAEWLSCGNLHSAALEAAGHGLVV